MTISQQPYDAKFIAVETSCCAPFSKPSQLQKNIDILCRLALGVFAAIYAPLPFLVSLSTGLVGGAAYTFTRLYQNLSLFPDGESKPVCAQGYMDFLCGMRFPPIIGTLATATFIAAHTRHDPFFYAPFCGLFIGFWLGREGAMQGKNLMNYVFQPLTFKEKPKNSCCCTI